MEKHYAYVAPGNLIQNEWALVGEWTMKKKTIVLTKTGGRIVYRFHARDLHLVMGPTIPGSSIRFKVLIDGQPPTTARGIDIDKNGFGKVTSPRIYQLIRQINPIVNRHFEIEFLEPGLEAFAFTFG